MSKKRKVDFKQSFFNEIVQKTYLHVHQTKNLEIINAFDLSVCEEKLAKVGALLKNDCTIDNLQTINNEMSAIFKNYGTNSLEDLISVCIGKSDFSDEKYDLIRKHFHPINYKVVTNKQDKKSVDLECADVSASEKSFHMKVYGMKLCINNKNNDKSLIVHGYLDDIHIYLLNDPFINKQQISIRDEMNGDFDKIAFERFISSLQLKDYLVWNQFNSKFAHYLHQYKTIQGKSPSQTMKDFVASDNFTKRNILITLLTINTEQQLLAYLLYDIISNDNKGEEDSKDQTEIYNSFPHSVKEFFKEAMKKTVQYTNKLTNFDMNKVPLEQQICLMNVPDHVKEKAMVKLKEVKSKSEDSGSKSRQYLDGLLKIPFGVYKREPILDVMENVKKIYGSLCKDNANNNVVDIIRYIKKVDDDRFTNLKQILLTGGLKESVAHFNEMTKLNVKAKTKKEFQSNLDELFVSNRTAFRFLFIEHGLENKEVDAICEQLDQVKQYTNSIKTTLDESVHGHDNAKKQIERIVGQWINGKPNGYCLGFEGNPGVGKTTLAKGLANCLKDENGEPRPFTIIAIGGDSNASTLVGHSFTYVGSIWGKIAQVVQDKKCMNPIILFDEIDKLSKTEHGKEITGILTHLLDPTQNDTFEDKYFAGIDLDLSKALFILSYNDPSAIDSILLDRVHRVKFESLTLDDKIAVAKKHLLPEIYDKFNLENSLVFKDETIQFIAENYTLEPGARKLKEKLYEIVGDYNLEILKDAKFCDNKLYEITIDQIKNKYFKEKREVTPHKIHTESKVGLINALWANAMSQGGVLPLQVSWVPAGKFLDLTLTGSLGDVMKESISVSLTNAWNLTSSKVQKELIKKYNNSKENEVFGLHVHCPSIGINKDGPSATTAFTVLLYSLFNDRKIRHDFGITGETHFGYDLTEIGGLQHKIIHSIPCGIKEFIFPVENKRDFEKIMDKYKDKEIVKGIKFHCIQTVAEVLELILEA